MIVRAVKQSPRPFVLSLSPGTGMTVTDATKVAKGRLASFYRITSDFHATNSVGNFTKEFMHGLEQHAFVIGNFTQLTGMGSTWPE